MSKAHQSQDNMILHQWKISPYCGKIRKVLESKDLRYTTKEYPGLRALLATRLSKVGKLPVLEINGEQVQDSRRIITLLEERYPEPSLIPYEGDDRFQAFLLQDWADESLYWFEIYFRFACEPAYTESVKLLCASDSQLEYWLLKMGTRKYQHAAMAQGIARYSRQEIEGFFMDHMMRLNDLLSDRQWLVGENKTIADIAVSSQLDEMVRTSHMKDALLSLKNLNTWLRRNAMQTNREIYDSTI